MTQPFDPAHQRLAALLRDRPDLAAAINDLLDILDDEALSAVDAAAAENKRHTRTIARLDAALNP
jgi:hypothetical protein